jgi:hypothetical protein
MNNNATPGRTVRLRLAALATGCTLAGWSAAASATLPVPWDALANIEATVATCQEVDARRVSDYQQRLDALEQTFPRDELGQARRSEVYKSAYDSTRAQLKEMAPDEVLTACRGFVEGRS